MASRNVELAVRMSVDASNVAAEFGSVGDAAKRMGDDIATGTATADESVRRLDGVAEAADGTASATSQAAGGLGDLGGALAMLPGPLGAVGGAMEATAPLVMGVTGAADLANLAMRKNAIGAKIMGAGQKVAAVGTRILNAALRASPLGIILTVLLLVGGAFVLAYKKSETFRRIVDAVVSRVKETLGGLIDKLGDLIGWVRDKVPAAWEALKDKVRAVVDTIKSIAGGIATKVSDVAGTVRSALGGAFDWVRDKVQSVVDLVQNIIDKIANIKLPDIPFLGRSTADTGKVSLFGGVTPAGTIDARIQVTLEGGSTLSADNLRSLEDLQRRQAIRLGQIVPGARAVYT